MDSDSRITAEYVIVVDRLARIEEKLDRVLKEHADHEVRIRAIERWKYALPLTAITAAASAAVTLFGMIGR
ncbi:hypothetical protein [Streptomyces griseus]|uniref:hypothetical protein n=1 Tax=Streptomyces griseus TaxID=1911 RepID=UPI0034041824